MSQRKLKIGIIGAGVGGLCTAKYAIESGHSVVLFEQTSTIGGTWNYTDNVGVDEFGLEIHTSMYHGLRTNLPKEIMRFSDFPFQKDIPESYIRSDEYLDYLKSYVDHFELLKYIKFNNYVVRVRPIDASQWEFYVRDLHSDEHKTYIFDAIFVCNGHYSHAALPEPKYRGSELFKGIQIHSHAYRRAEHFAGKKVLIIGAGPSGIDLTFAIARTATRVYFSHHTHSTFEIPENIDRMGSVKEFTEDEAIFVDGERRKIDAIIYCTGYKMSFPFLSIDCGICTNDEYVHPLYKHIFNINHPTMAFIGLPVIAVVAAMMELQVRYAVKMVGGERPLPTKEEMKISLKLDLERRRLMGLSTKMNHVLGMTFQVSSQHLIRID